MSTSLSATPLQSADSKILAASQTIAAASVNARYASPPISNQAFDCSYFVWLVIRTINPLFKRESSAAIASDRLNFRPVIGPPQAGQIIYFPPGKVPYAAQSKDKRIYPGHVAIMISPTSFIGMQDTGVRPVDMSNLWWSSRQRQFFQYIGPTQ